MFYVYCLFRPNGVPCYIGKGSGDRISYHWSPSRQHRNPHLAAIIRQGGGRLPSVVLHEGLTESQAFEYERALIAAIGRETVGGPLVNMTDGGEGQSGRVVTDEARRKMSEGVRAKFADPVWAEANRVAKSEAMRRPEVRARVGEAGRGRRLTDEQRQARSERQRGRKIPPESVAKTAAANRGKKRSAAYCQKQSKAKLAWYATNGTDILKGKPKPQELRDRISASVRAYYGARRG
jgi:hypothetical protein